METHQVIVGEAVAGRAASVRRSLAAMIANLSTNTFDLAALLHEAREHGYYAAWGFSSLSEYAEQELGLKKRKSEYLVRIMYVTKTVGLKRHQFEPCGVSKLREICRLDPEGTFWNVADHVSEGLAEHIVRLILDHDKLNIQQTKDEVARLLGQTGSNRRVVRSYSTDITTWQNVIDVAIERARRWLGSKGRDEEGNAREYSEGECYECICAAFNADLNYDEDPENKIDIAEEPQASPILPMESV
jgi:hypothetical protein